MRCGVFFFALAAAWGVEAMPLGVRMAMWGIAPVNRRTAAEAVFPDLGESATAAEIAAALGGAADGELAANITEAAEYADFRDWARGVGATAARASDTAWLSFALGASSVVPPPKDGDLVIDVVSVSSGGAAEAVFALDGVRVGKAAAEVRLKTIFGVEGAATLEDGAFSSANLDFSLTPTGDGRIKTVVAPHESAADTFFLRVKMK